MKKTQKDIGLQILKLIGMGAVFTAVSILSPIFLYEILKQSIKTRLHKPYNRQQIQNSVNYLKRKKFIAYPAKSRKQFFILTNKGRRHLLGLKIAELQIKKTAWDKKWRLVIFDIPEEATPDRFRFRRILKNLGFLHLQRSVFILPYPCEKQINLICQYLKIDNYVHILTTDRFVSDRGLVNHFRLK